jgi:NAD(P) transhydrogenase
MAEGGAPIAPRLAEPAGRAADYAAVQRDFDLLVIGSGPAGQKAAIQASKLGRRVAVVDRGHMIGGVSIHTGTIPSKTLREAVLYLTGMSQRGIYGQSYRVKHDITSADLFWRMEHVINREVDVIRNQLGRNHITLINGDARFAGTHAVVVRGENGEERTVTASKIMIAVGTRPARPASVEFDGATILDSDDILNLDWIPSSLVVVGAGVIGIEYASMFAALGTRVTVVERRGSLLEFVDSQVVEALQYHLRDLGVVFRFAETVTGVEKHPAGAITHLASGKRIPADAVLYSAGRQGATDTLDLERAGLTADARGRIDVNARYRTRVRHIYAAGDVIGFPSLAASSMEQGRLAAADAFGLVVQAPNGPMPIGIYTIPEISYVGRTEEQLTSAAIPYEVGISRYRELARGQILGDSNGMLKLLVSSEDDSLLGVHVFGTGATELVHIGQMLMATGGTIDHLVDAVFNYPTLAESYKVAALDAMNRVHAIRRIAS